MSDKTPTYYKHCTHDEQPMEAEADLCNLCLPWLGFVPVVPCEHGKYDRHKDGVVVTEYAPNGEASQLEIRWCTGAALEEER